jgi:FtsH-binding integral membrane protein
MATLLSGARSETVDSGAPPVSAISIEARLGFLRKVYSLFTAGVGVAAIGSVAGFKILPQLNLPPFAFLILFFVAFFVTSAVRKTPVLNMVAFFGFMFIAGLMTTPLLAVTLMSKGVTVGMANIVTAFGGTTLAFGGLTAYVFITRKDFSWMGGFLWMGFFGLFGFCLLTWLLPMMGISFSVSPVTMIGINLFGLLLFAGYTLYDTSNILHHYSESEYVMGALVLALDFIYMFWYLLQLLNSRD